MTESVKYLPTKEVADRLSVSDEQVKGLIFNGTLPAINVGKGKRAFWRVAEADLDAFLKVQRAQTAERFGGAA